MHTFTLIDPDLAKPLVGEPLARRRVVITGLPRAETSSDEDGGGRGFVVPVVREQESPSTDAADDDTW